MLFEYKYGEIRVKKVTWAVRQKGGKKEYGHEGDTTKSKVSNVLRDEGVTTFIVLALLQRPLFRPI